MFLYDGHTVRFYLPSQKFESKSYDSLFDLKGTVFS